MLSACLVFLHSWSLAQVPDQIPEVYSNIFIEDGKMYFQEEGGKRFLLQDTPPRYTLQQMRGSIIGTETDSISLSQKWSGDDFTCGSLDYNG